MSHTTNVKQLVDLKADDSKQSQGCQVLKEQLEQMWKVKFKVVLMVIGALDTVTPKLEEFLQQIPGQHQRLLPRRQQLRSWTEPSDPPRPLIEDLRDTHILYIYREDRDYADAAHCETSTLMKLL